VIFSVLNKPLVDTIAMGNSVSSYIEEVKANVRFLKIITIVT